jgi:hypothetical protein
MKTALLYFEFWGVLLSKPICLEIVRFETIFHTRRLVCTKLISLSCSLLTLWNSERVVTFLLLCHSFNTKGLLFAFNTSVIYMGYELILLICIARTYTGYQLSDFISAETFEACRSCKSHFKTQFLPHSKHACFPLGRPVSWCYLGKRLLFTVVSTQDTQICSAGNHLDFNCWRRCYHTYSNQHDSVVYRSSYHLLFSS